MDVFDKASLLETTEREAAIAARPTVHKGNGICIDCLETIEAARSNARRCLSCQQDEEHRQRIATGGRRV